MKGLTSRWRYRLDGAFPPSCASFVDRLLHVRGLSSDSAARFLDPRLTHLHPPELLAGIDRAAERILGALDGGEPIAVYGDYDVDGVTASAILYHTLRALAPRGSEPRIVTYIPHRLEEGYGLNSGAINELADQGVRVIVSVDCGVTAVDPAMCAKQRGVDLIITDHHNPPESEGELPCAFAVIHPRLPGAGAAYPFGDLCGAGVAYKLAWRLCTTRCGPKLPPELRTLLIDLLGFVALGVIADVVPLVDENRVLARFGLERIKHSSFVGLRALVEASGLAGEEVDSMGVGFRLAPRLNAAGRMGHAREALELFTTASTGRAREIASSLTAKNQQRQEVERAICAQACDMAEAAGMHGPSRRAVVLAHEHWHPGVVGIACSKLVERYCRPVILMGKTDGVCHGSGRSIDGFNLHAGLAACAQHLIKFGGHDMAAGLSLDEKHLDRFVEGFTEFANRHIGEEMLLPCQEIDCDAGIDELSVENVGRLLSLSPFGRGNPTPILRVRGVQLLENVRSMGAGARHVAFPIGAPGDESSTPYSPGIRVVGWSWAQTLRDAGEPLRRGTRVDLLIHPKLNTWNGRTRVEAELCDVCTV